MRSCALLKCRDLSGYSSDDALLERPLAERGWKAEYISWDAETDWSRFERVVIRATWDYCPRVTEFLDTLDRIEASGAKLHNSARIARWNARKTYLLELEKRGVPIVPTRIFEGLENVELDPFFQEWKVPELVLKPTVSGNAADTFRLKRDDSETFAAAMRALGNRETMIQPFNKKVAEVGEYSLLFFNGRYSHSILKTPKSGDFRVQEEHGGLIRAVAPPKAVREAAEKCLRALPEKLMYARVDLVEGATGEWETMELELIEPSLYLRMDPEAPARFAEEFAKL